MILHDLYTKMSPLLHAGTAMAGMVIPQCRFHPTCSEYSRESFKKYGFFQGLYKTLHRIARCNPLHTGGVDLP